MSIKQNIDFHITEFPYFLVVLNACLVMLIITLISLIPSVAHSHKVNIFAYAEDDKIFTESYFNDGSPCKESLIQVYDPAGNELLQGKTDEEGIFSFNVPKRIDLKIVLTASMGHKAEYRMPASEIPAKIESPFMDMDIRSEKIEPYPLSLSQKKEEPISSKEDLQKIEPSTLSQSPLSQKTAESIPSKIEPSPLSPEAKPVEIADQNSIEPLMVFDPDQIRSMVEDAVDRSIEKRMKPLINSMIHSMIRTQTARVSLTDIIGGVGYIFGIMGLILYFKKRDK